MSSLTCIFPVSYAELFEQHAAHEHGGATLKIIQHDNAVELLTKVFGSKKYTKKIVKRGVDFPRSDPHNIYKPEQVASH